MKPLDDLELRRRFAALREVEQSRAPSFASTLERARRRGEHRSRPAVLVLAAAASIAALVLCFGRSRPDPVPIETITAWHPATDALLPISTPTLFGPMAPLRSSVIDTLIRQP